MNHVLIGISGGIAAYKVCEVVSSLAKRGIEVRVIMTRSAAEFVTPLTFATLSRQPAYTDSDFWQPTNGRPLHIELAEWADVFLLAPVTANTLAKLAYGMADNLLTNTVLASTCPILFAPAMNTTMWLQPTVQENWGKLLKDARYTAIAPTDGILACDAVGTGRMAEPEIILEYLESFLFTKGKQDLKGKKILVNAGGTREFIDPVRFIGNPSTGKQGIAIAQAAIHRGAQVTLINTANSPLPMGERLGVRIVRTSAEMHQAMLEEFPNADITIAAAAVGDVRSKSTSDRKLPKSELPLNLELEYIPDIVADLAPHKRPDQILVGFAAQTGTEEEVVTAAKDKLKRKGLDAIAANAVNSSQTGFGTDTNQATFIDKNGNNLSTPLSSKLEIAHRLFDFLMQNFP
ncbi:bifunctional phosphopantothenoylcysteine decarboxylase/phosphopantothenate--cysteine ligase CoaBC [Pseudanabaena sp. FACHB-1998]|uniref:bifunctional phosphopantothenoylcysteine decarboxylase/phosphopantothenate--cysteine ligase CoaBC n=1 Tax=Pseudanabaena sp. FACHB-1998 TaxID=2692858 RepID=UPI0016807D6C|nr:bifunctional phosphopantothenoylcysteine decarboxylase/phosphopantothenate--cysteine ligase CoaBC [Pseudanabaena sp. FACHB-1998]MBD2177587.1 bifunctional phosphopantothenoylcysteine decarboxylase/phosphopantothenate--cysteine ligase CoaBC [Pseudanabaena sp. FACHB-1998]